VGQAPNANLRIALQALAFQLAWDIVMAHLVPGYMMQRAITLAAGFTTNPPTSVYFFDNKYFMQPGGQVHLWHSTTAQQQAGREGIILLVASPRFTSAGKFWF
jgi:hypothetical protein